LRFGRTDSTFPGEKRATSCPALMLLAALAALEFFVSSVQGKPIFYIRKYKKISQINKRDH
jgi:hypothetical protein